MYPPAPEQVFSPSAQGPAGLDAHVAQLFGSAPPKPASADEDVYANLDRNMLLERFKAAKEDGQELRWVFERQWWRVMLYVLGRQWIFFDSKRNEWRDKRLKKWIPKPVTNKCREVQNAIRSMFSAVTLGTISRPNGNDPKNIATANTVDGLQPLIHEEHKMDKRMRLADFWAINVGTVFLMPWWNPDQGEVKNIAIDQCTQCGQEFEPGEVDPMMPVCPQCGGEVQQVEMPTPTGRGCTDVVSPFEIILPSHASEFDEVDKIIRVRWRPKSYFEAKYPELAKTLSFEKQTGERSLHMFKALAAQNDMSTTPFSFGGGQKAQSLGITEYEYWEKPSAAFPRGLFFRVLGDKSEQIMEDPEQSTPGAIPVETNKGEPLWPWVHYSYEEFGGRLWSAGAIDPIIQKQDQLNQLDSHTELCLQRTSNPVWIQPKGTAVSKQTGEPGLVVEYEMVGVNGQSKPERVPGEAIPGSNFQLREQYLSDIEELAGTYDVLKGNKPTGVEAFSALQLLVERSQSRFTSAFAARGEAYREWFRIAIELERKYGPTQRTQALQGPNGTWTFQNFQNADLQGDVSIVVEDGTNVPKTALGKRAAMEQVNNMGMIDPQDPDVKHTVLSEMGLSNLMPTLDAKKKKALKNQDAFEKWADGGMPGAQPGPPDQMTGQPTVVGHPLKMDPWDDPQIFQNEFIKWANGDKMQAILEDPQKGPIVGPILVAFFEMLQMMNQPAIDPNTGQPVQGGPGAPQPGHGAGGGQAMGRSNTNSTKPSIANQGHPTAPVAPVGQ
jgi:predicted RNA-binding Zn-ribbon protein involved in translation (DUF1610 family)